MILSDFDLENMIKDKRLVIKPFDREIIRENGIDLRLADEVAFHNPIMGEDFVIDPSNEEHVQKEYIIEKNKKAIILPPRQQVLLSTLEYIKMPDNLIGFVELRSTWARHGLIMPPTIIDAGFEGTITLEVFNASLYKIKLRPKLRFAHIIFAVTMNRVKNTYKGSYNKQKGIFKPKIIR
ncbi:MAG: dCTP deaminase [Candidatus Micrarchaeia archaeon]|jgi:dCTP deaminase